MNLLRENSRRYMEDERREKRIDWSRIRCLEVWRWTVIKNKGKIE